MSNYGPPDNGTPELLVARAHVQYVRDLHPVALRRAPPPGVLGRLLRDERRKARAELLKAMVDDRDPYARLVAKEMILTAEET